MRHPVAGLALAVCGLCLVVGCTSDAVDLVGQDRVFGPQRRDSAPAWPGMVGVEVGDQPSSWWPVSSARDLTATGIDVVASAAVGGMVVDGTGAVWVDVPWGVARLDPVTWSTTVWDAGDDTAFAGKGFVRASDTSGVWLVGQDRARLFDGIRIVRDVQVPSAYLGEVSQGEERTVDLEGIRDLVEVGSELWIASEAGVARCDGHTWSMVGEGQLDGAEKLAITPWGEVWAGSWTAGGLLRWSRYDGTGWTPVDRPEHSGVDAIAWDPGGGIVAASGPRVVRFDGSEWQVVLRLDDHDLEPVDVRAVAASEDGTVWAITSEALLRSTDETGWHRLAAPEETSLIGLAVSGDEVVVSTGTGVYRVAGSQFELLWSPHQTRAVVPDITDVVSLSGDQAWIVAADWPVDVSPALRLQRVQVGRPDPALVAGLPASAEDRHWGLPPLSQGAAPVAASDGAIWYATGESVVRIAGGTESVVASGFGDLLVNVNVVAMDQGGPQRADPRPREIGPDGFAELTVPGTAIEQTLYGDGAIGCPDHWAHDLSLPVGQVQYTETLQGVEITVTLTQAWPDTEYYVEVNTDQFCPTGGFDGPQGGKHFEGLTTDRDGAGSLTLTYASRPPGARLLVGEDGAVWVLPTGRVADREEGDRDEHADWEGPCLLTPDGQCTPAGLPVPAQDIMSLVGGAGGNLWATVCPAGTPGGGSADPTCPSGWQLMRWEAGWVPVPYPGADVTALGAAPDGSFWAILTQETGEVDQGILAHYREGRWTTFPEFPHADDSLYDHDGYALTPAGSVCRTDDEGPTLVCLDTSLRISRTPVGVDGNVALADDGALWVWNHQVLARMPTTVP